MDRHGIGRKMEHEATHYLADLGYTNFYQPPRGKFTSQDIFGCLDLLAVSPEGCVEGFQICPSRPGFVEERVVKIAAWLESSHARGFPAWVLSYKRLKDGNIVWTWH